MTTANLEKAFDILAKATEEDDKKNYEESFRYYVQGIIYLLHVAKHEAKGELSKEHINEVMADYINKAKKVKEYLDAKKTNVSAYLDDLEDRTTDNVVNVMIELVCLFEDATPTPIVTVYENKYHSNIMANPTTTLQKATEILTDATEDDKSRYYEDALPAYVQGVISLIHVVNHEVEIPTATMLAKSKSLAYMQRAKRIKDYLEMKNIITVNKYLDDLETITDSDMVNVLFETICLYKESEDSSTVNVTVE
uniref:SFRICE_018249 n=1 Tax=Spodoptera frugiperda TaxID=7108 RepID=A0A2H1VF53_SPOFR